MLIIPRICNHNWQSEKKNYEKIIGQQIKTEKKIQIKSWFEQFLIGKEILQLERRFFLDIFNQIKSNDD